MTWFRPKTHGYGASPTNWKGWAAIAVFVAVETLLAFLFIVRPALAGTGPSFALTASWLILSGLFVWSFIRFVRERTDGEWRWRWGGTP